MPMNQVGTAAVKINRALMVFFSDPCEGGTQIGPAPRYGLFVLPWRVALPATPF